MRVEPAAPGEPQQAPPEETQPESTPASAPPTRAAPAVRASRAAEVWHATRVPNVFETRVVGRHYPGVVRRYRLSFIGPVTPPGFRWLINFEQVRRAARVFLNGRGIGGNRDPYTPFTLQAKGLKPGKRNTLVVIDDSRKDPELPEGWWNWGGIVRPVHLIPVGHAYIDSLGTMSKVKCRGPARGCKAKLFLDGILQRRGGGRIAPKLTVRLRTPGGRTQVKTLKLPKQRARRKRLQLSVKVPRPVLWSPDRPALYKARITLRDHGRVVQVVRRRVGLRQIAVKDGALYLNNRRINLRGASIHEDMPGSGAALRRGDMTRIVDDLKAVHANVTRAHYLISDRLLSKLDRAGIMVWQQSPIWQRDRHNQLLYPRQRRRAVLTVRRTVKAARNHPSVITHSVGNELTFRPDVRVNTKRYLTLATRWVRDLDPTVPVGLDINGRAGIPEQFTYNQLFDVIGINQYFGWYRWVPNFNDLEPYLREMHDLYPSKALVMTEFGAEGLPAFASFGQDYKGSYPFQAMHAARTIDVLDRLPFMSGGIYWTMREFEIYPGWTGGAPTPQSARLNTRHHKGLLTYQGDPKPAWFVARDHFRRTPLYVPTPAPPPAPARRR
jgi:glycosyl hydrolase family 2